MLQPRDPSTLNPAGRRVWRRVWHRVWHGAWVVRSAPPAVLLVLGVVQLLRDPPLWYDEAYTKLASGVPVGTLLSGMWHRTGVIGYLMDVPPSFNGPFYLLMHYWCDVFGNSDLALRLPSLICAAGAVAVVAELARRLAGPAAGLVAGLICATSPLLVAQAVQARDYGPAMLAVALCALWLERWCRDGRGLVRTPVTAAVAGLLHWFTLPVVIGFAVTALLLRRGAEGRRMALALGAACAPAALLVAWSLAGGTAGAPTPPAVGAWLPAYAVDDWAGRSIVLAVALASAGLVALVRSRHRVLIAGWVLVPLVLLTGLELARPTYFPRYLLFTLLGLAVAAALGVAALRPVALRFAGAAVLIGLSLSVTIPRLQVTAEEPSPAVVRLLAREQVAGQPIVPADGRTSLDLETYLALAPRLARDLVLPPTLFTAQISAQTSSRTVWLVRVVLKVDSLPVVPAEQRLIDAGWTEQDSTLVVGSTTDLRVERWTR